MRKMIVLSGLSSVLFLFAGPGAFGDGAFFVWNNQEADIFQPEQKALIEWDGQQEKLTVQTRYEGPAEEMVWVVPVPSKPEVRKGELSVLEEMSQRTQEPFLRHTKFFSEGLRAGYATPLESRSRVGDFDVAVLAPTGEQGVLAWLAANGFPLQPEQERIISDYVSRDWWVVASRVHPDAVSVDIQGKLAKGVSHPLEFTFATSRCVYPMLITSLARGTVEVLLWVKGKHHFEPETLAGPEWQVQFFGAPDDGFVFDDPHLWKPLQQRAQLAPEMITKMRRVFDASRITEDLYVKEADYVGLLDAPNPFEAAMAATQLGARKDVRAEKGLADYLAKAPEAESPDVRCAVWALGEIGRAHGLSESTMSVLAGRSKTKLFHLRLECFLALHKAKAPCLGQLMAERLEESLRENPASDDIRKNVHDRLERRLVSPWFHDHQEDAAWPRYCALVSQTIDRIVDELREDAGAELTHKGFGVEMWAIEEACALGDSSLLPCLARLQEMYERETIEGEPEDIARKRRATLLALGACGEPAARDEVLTCLAEDDRAFVSEDERRTRAYSAEISKASLDRRGSFGVNLLDVEAESTMARLARSCLSGSERDSLARELLARAGLSSAYSAYLLGWVPEPAPEHIALLRTIWQESQEEGKDAFALGAVALEVVRLWGQAALAVEIVNGATREDLRNRGLALLSGIEGFDAWPRVERTVRDIWDRYCASANAYPSARELTSTSSEDTAAPESLGFLEACIYVVQYGRNCDEYMTRYGALCGDSSLHPGTRYLLLGMLTWPLPDWAKGAAEAMFADAKAAGVEPADYARIANLAALLGCEDAVYRAWQTSTEGWQRDAAMSALLRREDPRGVEALKVMALEDWPARFRECAGNYGAFCDGLSQVYLPEYNSETVEFMARVLRDASLDPEYRTCLQARVWKRRDAFLPEIKAVMSKDLPEPIRAGLKSYFRRETEQLEEEREGGRQRFFVKP